MAMKLDFLLCGSATDSFFAQMAFFRLCLDALGGDYAKARLVTVFGDHDREALPEDWRPYYENIDVVWAHPVGAPNPCYAAQHNRRFDVIRPDADLAVLCDADVAILANFDDLAHQLLKQPALAGCIAHAHFPIPDRPRDPDTDWPEIARAVLGREIVRNYSYSLPAPNTVPAACPFYINYGVFMGTPALLDAFNTRERQLRPEVAKIVGDWWSPQVALALTCDELALPTLALPMRYNFPNDPRADDLYPDELAQAAFIHYLRPQAFRREEIFVSEAGFHAFLDGSFTGSNAIFRDRVAAVTDGRYPFAR